MGHPKSVAGDQFHKKRPEGAPPGKRPQSREQPSRGHEATPWVARRMSLTESQWKLSKSLEGLKYTAAPPPNATVGSSTTIFLPVVNSTTNGKKGSRREKR